MRYLLGFDIGGTKIEAALIAMDAGFNFKVLGRERVPTEREQGYDAILRKIKSLYERAKTFLPEKSSIVSVGLGLPGTIHPKTFKMLNGNTAAFVGHDLLQDFGDIFFDIERVELANDANCFALAEVLCGAGREHQKKTGKKIEEQLAVGVILGTGCGAGIIKNGQIIEGTNGGAGEMGHSLLVSGGRACFCGRQGCAEMYISGTGLEIEYSEISGRNRGTFGAMDVFALAKKHEPDAMKAVQIYCDYLARFIANMTNVIDPDYFVLGGGVSQQDVIYDGLHRSVEGDLFLPVAPPEIYKNSLGDSAGVIGAAILSLVRDRQ